MNTPANTPTHAGEAPPEVARAAPPGKAERSPRGGTTPRRALAHRVRGTCRPWGTLFALAGLALGLLAPPAAGAARWFTVEVVAFEHLAAENYAEETWPADPGAPDTTATVELVPSGTTASGTPIPFSLAPRNEWTLAGVYAALRRSASYRPLLHLAWRQPVLDRDSAPAVHLHPEAGLRYPEPEPVMAPGTLPPLVLRDESAPPPALDGTLRVHLARYLHVEADLVHYRDPTRLPLAAAPPPPPSAAETDADAEGGPNPRVSDAVPEEAGAQPGVAALEPVTRFRMLQRRRMRSQEIHYLDHPLFGVVVTITPYALDGGEAAPAAGEPEADPAGTPPPSPGDA